jgi:hypothetical protein
MTVVVASVLEFVNATMSVINYAQKEEWWVALRDQGMGS